MYNELGAYSVELYIGEVRSGKTLSMVADTFEDLKTKKDLKIGIFTNFHLKDSFLKPLGKNVKHHIFKKEDLALYYIHQAEFKSCIFLVDEFQTLLDSRNFMKGMTFEIKNEETGEMEKKKVNYNQAVSYFLGQMGKRGNVLRGTTHDEMLLDIRGRLYTQKYIYVFKGLQQPNGIWKQILNVNRVLSPDENDRLYMQKQSYIKKLVKTSFLPEFKYVKLATEYIKASDYFEMYDTEELI